MPIRETTRLASDHDTHHQRASTYHQHRLESINDGDHDLDDTPHAIVHIIPNGALEARDWSVTRADELSTDGLTDFSTDHAASLNTPTGRRLVVDPDDHSDSYTDLADTGIVETVSTRFATERGDHTYYKGHKLEAGITALASWADRQYASIDIEIATVHLTLQGVGGLKLAIPERARNIRETPTVTSDDARPFPHRIEPMDESERNHHQIREDLSPLFDSLWGVAEQYKSPYFGNGAHHRFIANQAERFE